MEATRRTRWLLGGVALLTATGVLAEEITLTTYYPSPRGVYETLRVTGDVGIGTMSLGPGAKLHVKKGTTDVYDVAGNTAMVIENSAHAFLDFDVPSAYSAGLRMDIAGDTRGAVVYDGPGAVPPLGPDAMRFWTAGAERMRINNVGHVGIGTTSPTQKLEVRDSSSSVIVLATTAASAGEAVLDVQNEESANHLSLRSYGTTGTGPWGGATHYTSVPVGDSIALLGSSGTPHLVIGNPGGAVHIGAGGGIAYATAPLAMTISANGGHVGIGTTSPSQKLEVLEGQIRLLDVPWDSVFQTPRISNLVFNGAPGLLVSAEADYAFFGLEPVGGNRADALIEWGDDPAENGVPASWDSLKFVHMQWWTGTRHERLRIDPAGNLGLGTPPPRPPPRMAPRPASWTPTMSISAVPAAGRVSSMRQRLPACTG